ncbi:MAG: ATP-dependent helicase [Candidatus Yonathbacteria bacterium]|nr:ATP-dependent helicase [Candidatus Yonathbacteria bacterium]NTW47392.1 ATP-dependent helicase [Candidatus Yonathbacteria bacterium]
MVEERLKLEPEVQEIFTCIDNKRNFLLSGGAGSGKTHSLVQVIKQVIAENPTSRIACMTFTNAAVKQIEERIGHANLSVSTIHDFLWDNIKHFQNELKIALVSMANDPLVEKIKIEDPTPVPNDFFDPCEKGIQYKEYLKLNKGIISHDELLLVANYLFENYPKLCDIVKDKFGFIFIDEYQDTDKAVVVILLDHFNQSVKHNIVGFFGDAMQSIYDDGIGNLDAYKGTNPDQVQEIKKEQNRRNPRAIIDLANRLRTDGITQVPSIDRTAPNMTTGGEVKEGIIKFIYSTNPDIDPVRSYLSENFGWDFSNSKETKELNLTHNLIADKAGFRTLMDIYDKERILELKYKITKEIKEKNITIAEAATFGEVIDQVNLMISPTTEIGRFLTENPELYEKARGYLFSDFRKIYADKEQLLDDKKQDEEDENKKGTKRDNLIRHLFKIQNNIFLYQNKQYNEFLRVTDFSILTIGDKEDLQKNIEELTSVGDKTIEEIINLADENGICFIDDNLVRFKIENEYLYDRVKEVKFSEFQKLYDYLEGKTPFSTQHKTKGAEFDNVFIILDNGKWNDYNFENLFLGSGKASVLERTQKIFYVCCTRSKEKLAVFFHDPSAGVITKAQEWFGAENVISLP